MTIKHAAFIVSVILIYICCRTACHVIRDMEEPYRKFKTITPGMSEAQVRARFGEPYKEYTKDNAPADYYMHGYHYEQRQISDKVLIYLDGEYVCYVYLDASGKVEHLVTGGS